MAAILKIFFALLLLIWSSIGQLTRNLVGSKEMTFRSKLAKIIPFGNPIWPPWPPSWKSILKSFSLTERPIDSKLDIGSIEVTCRSKQAIIVPIRHPSWSPWLSYCSSTSYLELRGRPRWLSWMRRPTGDQEVAGSTPAEVGNILSWRLIMKYFLRSFSPFRWFKKGSCQFLTKECAQYWLTA